MGSGSGSEGGSGSLLSEGSSGTETLLSGAEETSGREELSSLDSDSKAALLSPSEPPKGSFESSALPKTTHAPAPRPSISTAQIIATATLRFVCFGWRIFMAFGS